LRAGAIRRIVSAETSMLSSRLLPLLVLCPAPAAVAADASEQWIRSHVRLETPDGRDSGSSYTLLVGPDDGRMKTRRVLLTTLDGRQLVADFSVKTGRTAGEPASRWLNLFLLPGGRHLNISIVANQYELQFGGEAVQVLALEDAPRSAGEFGQVREMIAPSLLAGVRELVRLGLDLEPGWREEAELLAATLLLGDDQLEPIPEQRPRVLVEPSPFDPHQQPLPAELEFGPQYFVAR
jgi:hypothetical protein